MKDLVVGIGAGSYRLGLEGLEGPGGVGFRRDHGFEVRFHVHDIEEHQTAFLGLDKEPSPDLFLLASALDQQGFLPLEHHLLCLDRRIIDPDLAVLNRHLESLFASHSRDARGRSLDGQCRDRFAEPDPNLGALHIRRRGAAAGAAAEPQS